MALLLFPLHGALLVITLAVTLLTFAALIGIITQPTAGFPAADKQTKWFWVLVMVLGAFVPIVGVIGGIVYFIDVRPAVQAAGPGGGGGGPRRSSSDGPYGPFRS